MRQRPWPPATPSVLGACSNERESIVTKAIASVPTRCMPRWAGARWTVQPARPRGGRRGRRRSRRRNGRERAPSTARPLRAPAAAATRPVYGSACCGSPREPATARGRRGRGSRPRGRGSGARCWGAAPAGARAGLHRGAFALRAASRLAYAAGYLPAGIRYARLAADAAAAQAPEDQWGIHPWMYPPAFESLYAAFPESAVAGGIERALVR